MRGRKPGSRLWALLFTEYNLQAKCLIHGTFLKSLGLGGLNFGHICVADRGLWLASEELSSLTDSPRTPGTAQLKKRLLTHERVRTASP